VKELLIFITIFVGSLVGAWSSVQFLEDSTKDQAQQFRPDPAVLINEFDGCKVWRLDVGMGSMSYRYIVKCTGGSITMSD